MVALRWNSFKNFTTPNYPEIPEPIDLENMEGATRVASTLSLILFGILTLTTI